ncbi:MAG: glycine-rich domain-containing protein [Inhella sp.]|jgi:hypothetical protein|uniref:glycine-rich domain-containing protein n=1 Tax=Inhella sp. TaxID=1921806 RepID=UPI00391A9AB4
MTTGTALLVLAFLAAATYAAWQHRQRRVLAREQHIRTCVFPSGVLQGLQKAYPHLDLKGVQLTARALRQFFLVHARANGGLVAMPSKAADALWHAFILDTRAYRSFCMAAFGSYLHHLPEGAMRQADNDGSAIWRTWRLACREENIHPKRATRLPLLFALDAKLGIADAVVYDPAAFKPPPSKGDGCGGSGCGGTGGNDGGDGGGCGGGE